MDTYPFPDLDLLSTNQLLDQFPSSFMGSQGNMNDFSTNSYHRSRTQGHLNDLSSAIHPTSRMSSSASDCDFMTPPPVNVEFVETDFLTDNHMLKDHNNNDKPSLIKQLASDSYELTRNLNGTSGLQKSLGNLLLDSHDTADISQTLRKEDLMFSYEDSMLPICESDNIPLDKFIIRGDTPDNMGRTNFNLPRSRAVNPQNVLPSPINNERMPIKSSSASMDARVPLRTNPVMHVRTTQQAMKPKQSAPRLNAQGERVKSKRGRKPGQGKCDTKKI